MMVPGRMAPRSPPPERAPAPRPRPGPPGRDSIPRPATAAIARGAAACAAGPGARRSGAGTPRAVSPERGGHPARGAATSPRTIPTTSAPSPRAASVQPTPVPHGQGDQPIQAAPRSIASCRPTDGWIRVARTIAKGAVRQPRSGRSTTTASASQPRAKPIRRSSSIGSNRWFVPMLPALAARTRPTATTPTRGPASGQAARQAVQPQAGRGEGQPEQERQPRREPQRPARRVEQGEVAAMGVEGVERPHERVVGEERGDWRWRSRGRR